MTAVVDPDGSVLLASRRLADAVCALVDPSPVRIGGGYRWQRALYSELRSGLTGQSARRALRTQRRSRAPLRLEVLQLLIEIDDTAARWVPDGNGTVERLRALAAGSWRPQDVARVEHLVDDLQRWALAAAELLAPEPRVYLPMPCPRCDARYTYRRRDGGEVRTAALRVGEAGCRCSACGAFWPPAEFGWLARLLGCQYVRRRISGSFPQPTHSTLRPAALS